MKKVVNVTKEIAEEGAADQVKVEIRKDKTLLEKIYELKNNFNQSGGAGEEDDYDESGEEDDESGEEDDYDDEIYRAIRLDYPDAEEIPK